MSDLIMGKATVADAIAIVQFAWGIAVDVNPGLRALSSAESVAVALAPLIAAGIASGAIHSGASGEGQTAASDQTHGRYQGQ
jgi:hypothetical protein